MNKILTALFLIIVISSCKKNKIARSSDYTAFLIANNRIEKQVEKTDTEIAFWQKRLDIDTSNFVNMEKLASNYSKRFKLTGTVNDLKIADSFYASSLRKIKNTQPELYFSISQNAITQHRFRDAWDYLQLADSIGVNPYTIKLLKFDAAMEIGLYKQAENLLQLVKNEHEFDYLIRKSKLEDRQGRLDNAIHYMEMASKEAEALGNKEMILWSKSNLGDMYGHDGRVKEAYSNYLGVLKMDSSYLHALKGIAWIAFSYDKNIAEAKRIIHYIQSQTSMPDLNLILAEIAEWEGDMAMKDFYISSFVSQVEKPGYGNMYNKYLITVYTEDLKQFDKALFIAQKEIKSRPTPETYDWLAWVNFKKGDLDSANTILEKYVLGKTAEPNSLFRAALILYNSGKKSEAKKLLQKCTMSSFELGPVYTDKINALL